MEKSSSVIFSCFIVNVHGKDYRSASICYSPYICVFYSEQMCVDAHAQRQIPFSLKKKNIIILLSLLLLNLFRFCFLLLSTQHLLGV